MRTMNRWVGFGMALVILLADLAGCSGSGSNLLFFRDKTVTIIVPYGAGGGIDTYARSVAPYLQKYLPGSKVVVQNVTDNGGVTGKNLVFAAQPDGLTLGFAPMSGALLTEWGENPGVAYETAEFSYIGRLNTDLHVMVASPRSHITQLSDIARLEKISMGFTGAGSDDYYVGLIAARLLGYQVEARTDYLSSSDAGLACVRGDVDAVLFSDSSLHSQIVAQTVVPVAVFNKSRMSTLPEVPTIFEAIPADRQPLLQALVEIYALDRTMIAPPGMDPARLKTLRDALDKAVVDPEYLQNMAALKRPVDYLSGADLTQLLQGILSKKDQIKPLVFSITQGSK